MADQTQLFNLHDILSRDNKARLKKYTPVDLHQSDFVNGTYIISSPGVYRLVEDISFNPNSLYEARNNGIPGVPANPSITPWNTGRPTTAQFSTYSPAAFGIGFFAAIVITANDVTLDLNGHTLEQSLEHSIQQRFYAQVELANQPFVPSEGPHNFGNTLKSATKTAIINGTMGRSAHHQIHGNNCDEILIENIKFRDHETAAVSINGARNTVVNRCRILRNQQSLGLTGIYSSTRFLQPYLDALATAYSGGDTSLTVDIAGVTKTAVEIRDELRIYTNTAYDALINNAIWWNDTATGISNSFGEIVDPKKPYKLFHNEAGVQDGNSYGYLFNSEGNAVGGFPTTIKSFSENILLKDLTVEKHYGDVVEVLPFKTDHTLTIAQKPPPQTDATGAIFQTQNKYGSELLTIDVNDYYVGNPVANAQLLVAKHKTHASLSNLDTSTTLRITSDTLAWAASGSTTYASHNLVYMCNGDSMFHVNKGMIGYRIDSCKNVMLSNCKVIDIKTYADIGSNICGNYTKGHPDQTLSGYGGCSIRGFNFASTYNLTATNCSVDGCDSYHGEAFGFDIQQKCHRIELNGCEVNNLHAGSDLTYTLSDYDNNPTRYPNAIGFNITADPSSVKINSCKVTENITAKCTPMKFKCNQDKIDLV